jgi:PAS domain S-box-containing protein
MRKNGPVGFIASEERFKMLFDYAPDAYYLIDTKGIFIDGNKAAENIIGFKKKELIGKSIFKAGLLSADQFHKAAADITKNIAGKAAGPTTYSLKRSDGTMVWMEIRTYPVKIGGKKIFLGIARDVTYRREDERERELMRRTNELFSGSKGLDEAFSELPKILSQTLHFPIVGVALRENNSGNIMLIGSVGLGADNDVMKLPANRSLAGVVIRTGKPLFVGNARKRKEYSGGPLKKFGIITFMGAPLRAGGKTIGALLMADHKQFRNKDRAFQMLQNISANLSRNIEKTKAIEELRKNEEKYRYVANFTYDWEYWIDERGTMIYCSPSCERITGYKAGEFLKDNKLSGKIIHHDFKKKYNANMSAAGGVDGVFDYKIIKKNGKEAWISHSSINVFNSLGNRMGKRCCDREVTEKVIIENSLQESEKKFRSLFNNANDAIFLHTIEKSGLTGRFLEVNVAACVRLGYTREELLKMKPEDIDDPEQIKRTPDISAKLLKEGHITFESFEVTKSGKMIPVEINAHIFDMSGKKVVIAIARDTTERKLNDSVLKESEERYRSLFKNLNDGFAYHRIIFDGKGTPVDYEFLEVNEAFEKIMGMKRGEILGKKVTEIIPGIQKDSTGWIERYASVALSGVAEKFETYSDVLGRWFNISVYSDKKGYFATIFEDVTERRKTTEKITMLSAAMEQSANAVVITNLHGDITYVNPRFTEITGYTAAEAIGNNPKLLKSGYFTPEQYKEMWDTIISGNVWRGRFHNKKKNGKLYWESATITPIKNAAGDVASFMAIKEDITAVIEAEEQAKESQDMLLDFLDNANDMIQIVKPDFKFEYVNKQWIKTLGYAPEKLFKMNIFDVVAHEARKNFTELYAKMTAGDGGHFLDTVFVAADGRKIIVEGNINCFVESGSAIHTRAILRDVTEKRKAENELLNNYSKLKELDVLKSNFTAMVSHELRTPLTAIKGFTAFLLGDAAGGLNFKQREYTNIIKNNSERLLNLINEILDISKMESGTFSIVKKKEELTSIIDKALSDIASMAERKKLILDKKYIQEFIEADIDEYRISQVLLNLLNNAIKFSPEEGHIYVGAEIIPAAGITPPEYTGFKQNNITQCVHIWVKDEGVGIDEENLKKIFDRFYQVSDQEHRIFKGVGLGLNISKNIVQAHGGVIWVQSPGRDKGAVFHILLPIN